MAEASDGATLTQEADSPPAPRLEHRLCPRCGRDNRDRPVSPYAVTPWALRDCAGCGFVYLENPPVYEELADSFSFDKTFVAAAKRKRHRFPLLQRLSAATRWRLHLFPRKSGYEIVERHVPEGQVVDLGCGSGAYLAALPERYQVCGVEISTAMAEQARDMLAPRGGVVINAPSVEGLRQLPLGQADCVMMRSYLEHESRPALVLRATHDALRPGGIVIIKVPNYGGLNRRVMGARWCGFRWPDHVNQFTPASLRAMVEEAGLRVVRFSPLDHFPTADNMWLVAARP